MAFINDHTWSVKVVRRLIRRPNLCLIVPKERTVVAFFAAQMWSENCFEALLLNGFFRFLSSVAPMNLFLHQLFLSLAVRACLCKFSSSREQNDSSEGQTESTKMILGQEVFETQEVERDGQPLEIRIRGFPL